MGRFSSHTKISIIRGANDQPERLGLTLPDLRVPFPLMSVPLATSNITDLKQDVTNLGSGGA